MRQILIETLVDLDQAERLAAMQEVDDQTAVLTTGEVDTDRVRALVRHGYVSDGEWDKKVTRVLGMAVDDALNNE
jgi:hypothetical protein